MARVLIVEARFYAHLNDMLLAGARKALDEGGHSHETVTVPGALEIPGAIAIASDGAQFEISRHQFFVETDRRLRRRRRIFYYRKFCSHHIEILSCALCDWMP